MTERPRRQWFDPRMSIGNVITILVVMTGIIAGWFQFDNRLAALEKDLRTDRMLREAEDQRLAARLTVIEASRGDLSSRVIRIEERLVNQGEKIDRVLSLVEGRLTPRR